MAAPTPPPGRWMQRRPAVVRALMPLLLAGVFVLAFRLAFTPYVIPTESMSPAIAAGDRVLASPLTGGAGRGDIITFTASDAAARSCAVAPGTVFAKRVVGVPGDRVEVRGGQLWVNGRRAQASEEPRIEYAARWPVVPAGALLVLGDNRNASCDSHVWQPDPWVREDQVLGVVVGRFWPPTRIGRP